MIRIDDEEENRGVRRQFFPFENIIVGRDARRPAEPSVHLFSTERGPSAGAVRERITAKPMNSVFEREPWTGKSGKRGPGAGAVRARITAKPMNSVFEREPWTGKSGKRGPGAGAVRAHLPAKPMNSVFEREPGDAQNSKTRPTRRRSPTGPAAPQAIRRSPPAQQRLNQSGGAPPARQRPPSSAAPHRDRRQAHPLRRSPGRPLL